MSMTNPVSSTSAGVGPTSSPVATAPASGAAAALDAGRTLFGGVLVALGAVGGVFAVL